MIPPLLAFMLASSAAPPRGTPCAELQKSYGNLEITIRSDCIVLTDPTLPYQDAHERRERAYGLFPDGNLMVFIGTYDDPDESKANGSRNFFLFPRQTATSAVLSANAQEVVVRGPTGGIFHFSTETADLIQVEGAEIHIDPVVSLQNQGGLEFTGTSGLILDTRWKLGGTGQDNLNASSVIWDRSGHSCTLVNHEIFHAPPDDVYNRIFNFTTDSALESFLSQRCPELEPIAQIR